MQAINKREELKVKENDYARDSCEVASAAIDAAEHGTLLLPKSRYEHLLF